MIFLIKAVIVAAVGLWLFGVLLYTFGSFAAYLEDCVREKPE